MTINSAIGLVPDHSLSREADHALLTAAEQLNVGELLKCAGYA
jgi:hypothetical protein